MSCCILCGISPGIFKALKVSKVYVLYWKVVVEKSKYLEAVLSTFPFALLNDVKLIEKYQLGEE